MLSKFEWCGLESPSKYNLKPLKDWATEPACKIALYEIFTSFDEDEEYKSFETSKEQYFVSSMLKYDCLHLFK